MSYASLRAIETRRSIVRSANTGISCFISQKGELLMKTNYWEPTSVSHFVNENEQITIYTQYGDYIGRISLFASIASVLIVILQKLKIFRKRKDK
jgi:apolipoprotein N-acyltransferase